MKYKEIDYNKAFKILDELLDKYDIPNKLSQDGITKIDGMSVDEYFDKIGLFNNLNQERDNNMHVNVLVKVKDGQNELYPRQLAQDTLLELINYKIDYFVEETIKTYTYEELKNNIRSIEPYIFAYINEYGEWISEPTLRELNESLINSNKNDLFYLVDCHI